MMDDFDDATRDARALLARLRGLYLSLAADPSPGRPEEEELSVLLRERQVVVERLGRVLWSALSEGHTVRLVVDPPEVEPGSDEGAAVPIEVPPESVQVVEAARPAPVLADPERLEALSKRGLQPQWTHVKSPAALRHALIDVFGALDRQASAELLARQVSDVVAVCDRWAELPVVVHKPLIGLVSSLARHVQDERRDELPSDVEEQLRSSFSTMTAWSKAYQPGFVPGLSRHNHSYRSTWWEDAKEWHRQLLALVDAPPASPDPLHELTSYVEQGDIEPAILRQLTSNALNEGVAPSDPQLVRLLLPHASKVGPRVSKTLNSALKSAAKDEEEELAVVDASAPVPDDWPLRDRLEGRDAVIVGGDPRPRSRDRIRKAFGLNRVEWDESNPRRIQALAGRIRRGNLGVLIILRGFVNHSDTEALVPACKESNVPYCLVDQGYGVSQVRAALERYLGGP